MLWRQFLVGLGWLGSVVPADAQDPALPLCSTNSATGELVFRINETVVGERPNLILDLSADVIGAEDEVRLEMAANPGGFFRLAGQQLVQIAPIDRDAGREALAITLLCRRLDQIAPLKREVRVRVVVEDLNDNPPVFADAPYTVTIDEDLPAGSLVFDGLRAVDPDSGLNAQVVYSILPQAGDPGREEKVLQQNGSDYFTIPDPSRGEVVLKLPLQGHPTRLFSLVILASDLAEPRSKRQTSRTRLGVRVRPRKGPRFRHPSCPRNAVGGCNNVLYTASVRTGVAPLPQPLSLSPNGALKVDPASVSRPVTYSVLNGTPAVFPDYFQMDQRTGDLYQTQPIPFGLTDKFDALVMAREDGAMDRFSVARLEVEVADALPNNYPPVLQVNGLQGFVPENAPVGTVVRVSADPQAQPLRITVTDQDLEPGMPAATYQYILTGLGASVFAVNQNSEVVVNVPNLDSDRPNPAQYQLTVQAREVGTEPIRSSDITNIDINVVDVNDNAPSFPQQLYSAQVPAAGALRDVLMVGAADGDRGVFGELRYRIVSVTNGGEPMFRYNADRGTLVVLGDLVSGEQYQVLLEAQDGGGRRAQTVVLVTAVGPGGRPLGPQPTQPSPDQGQGQRQGQGLPEPRQGLLPSAQPSVFEYQTSISELSPPNTVIVSLGDSSTPLATRFLILSGNDEGLFRMDETSGTISTTGAFDREQETAYRLVVQSGIRGQGVANTTIVNVSVEDANDNAPRFLGASQGGPIVFNAPVNTPGAFIGRVEALDPDEGSNSRFRLRLLRPHPLFAMDEEGNLRTRGPVPPNGPPQYSLTVVARDAGQPPQESSAQLLINVPSAVPTDPPITPGFSRAPSVPFLQPTQPTPSVMDTIPMFEVTQYEVEVEENAGPQDLLQLSASAADGGSPTYVLKQGDPSLFSVDPQTGLVKLLSSLDAEEATSHRIVISTRQNILDRAPPRSQALISVLVSDRNDRAPTFSPAVYEVSVPSDAQPGSSLLQISATDLDLSAPNNQFEYGIVGDPDNLEGLFRINPQNGLIILAQSLRGVQVPVINLTVGAVDRGNPPMSSKASVVVRVAQMLTTERPGPGVPQAPPQVRFALPSQTVEVSEAATTPYFVTMLPLEGAPPDPRQIRCTIVSGNFQGVFALSVGREGNCELRTRAALDREAMDRYLLNISVSAAADSAFGQPQRDFTQLTVILLDANDNGPRFVYNYDNLGLQTYFAAVPLDQPIGQSVITVKATDDDQGPNSEIRYSLDPLTPDQKYFEMDPVTGVLRNTQLLDEIIARNPPFLELRVIAKDSPLTEAPMETKARLVVNLITEANRFRTTAEGILPKQALRYQEDMANILRTKTGLCSVLGVEATQDSADLAVQGKPGTDMLWYAINPQSAKICTRDEFALLFNQENFELMRGQMSQWFPLTALSEEGQRGSGGTVRRGAVWDPASIAWISLGVIIALGALLALFAMCYFWNRYTSSKAVVGLGDRPPLFYGALPKYNALVLPPSEKEYETQMLEMAVAEEERARSGTSRIVRPSQAYHPAHLQDHHPGHPDQGGGGPIDVDFTLEEGIYSVQHAPGHLGHFPPYAQRGPVIPPPDYPLDSHHHYPHSKHKKTML